MSQTLIDFILFFLNQPFKVGNISSLLDILSPLGPVESKYPLTFEEMKQVG